MVEKKPIVKIALWKLKEEWWRLSEGERNEFFDKIVEKYEEIGAKLVVSYCNCYWSNEEWQFFVVEEYPDIEAVQKYEEYLLEIGWSIYADSKLYLGTRMDVETVAKLFVKKKN